MKTDPHTDLALLEHIRGRIARIEEYTNRERSTFYDSHLVQDAVIRNLQTIAESSQRLSDGLKETEPEVPWRAIAGFRNVLVHDYFEIDLEVVLDCRRPGSAEVGCRNGQDGAHRRYATILKVVGRFSGRPTPPRTA